MGKEVGRGNFDLSYEPTRFAELNQLQGEIKNVVNVIEQIIKDLTQMAEEHHLGNTSFWLNKESYAGKYQTVVSGVNLMVNDYVENYRHILKIMQNIADGDFIFELEPLPGDKHEINEVTEAVRQNLLDMTKQIQYLIEHANNGDISVRADDGQYCGQWAIIIAGINSILEAMATPISEALKVFEKLASGDLDAKIKGQYKGVFKEIKDSTNHMSAEIKSYVQEIDDLLYDMAGGDLTNRIHREYVGNFSQIKTSLNKVLDSFNNMVLTTKDSSYSILKGSQLIADASISLSEGSEEQRQTINQLTKAISSVDRQANNTAQSARDAHNTIQVMETNIQESHNTMKEMLDSMNSIAESSNNIASIMKVIEDIAFQTNLLAINASVEAARAGAEGRGFAVVAEEVRQLAQKTKGASTQTNSLIADALEKSRNGEKASENMAKNLNLISGNIDKVTSSMNTILIDTQKQAIEAEAIHSSINEISQVVENNLAAVYTASNTAQDFTDQAEKLSAFIDQYKV